MRAYLERQMLEKAKAKDAAKKEAIRDDILREGTMIRALPVDVHVDEQEDAHVKLALKQTLDAQVERKKMRRQEELDAELEQQQQALDILSAEMLEKRTRDFMSKKEQKEALRQTWKIQQACLHWLSLLLIAHTEATAPPIASGAEGNGKNR